MDNIYNCHSFLGEIIAVKLGSLILFLGGYDPPFHGNTYFGVRKKGFISNMIHRQVSEASFGFAVRKTNMAMENRHVLIGDTSSNGCFSIVMLVLWGFTRAPFGMRSSIFDSVPYLFPILLT